MRQVILFVCIVLCFVHNGWSQSKSIDSLRIEFDKSYGLDVLLHNGKKYFPNNNPVIGYPYWKNKDSISGDITISGKTFKDQQLKYDINRQEFVLFYFNFNGQSSQIILNVSSIDSVNIGKCLFIPNSYPKIHQQFIQLVYQGDLSCYIGWYKELKLNTIGARPGFEYTKDLRLNYLVSKGSVNQFTNRYSFLQIFNPKERVSIRKYLKDNGLRFKAMNVNDLKKLIIFCEHTLI